MVFTYTGIFYTSTSFLSNSFSSANKKLTTGKPVTDTLSHEGYRYLKDGKGIAPSKSHVSCHVSHTYFYFIIFERQRQAGREKIPSRFHADSNEPNVGPELTNSKTKT